MTTLVVIGHGASPVGRGWGELIDQHPVVRLHECHLHPAADYGERYDFAVLPSPWLPKALQQIRRVPSREWWIYRRARQRRQDADPAELHGRPCRVETDLWTELERLIGRDRADDAAKAPGDVAVVTRGTAAIAMATRFAGARRIIAVGCDALLGDRQWSPYPAWHPQPTVEGTDRRHDMRREGLVLARWCAAQNVDLRRAEEVWA